MAQVRVLVVDDSVVVRKLVADSLSGDPDVHVVGTAANGRIALAKIKQLKPDLVTLDVEMPVMDGLETLVHLREEHPDLPVVMFSTLTDRGARATLTALERGANDYVTKPANIGSIAESRAAVREQLVPRVLGLCAQVLRSDPRPGEPVRGASPAPRTNPLDLALRADPLHRIDLVVIGSSTGGPDALTTVLPALPAGFPVPVLVTQHMPPVFTKQFADRLDVRSHLSVGEAVAGEPLRAGSVLVAPGDFHLRVGGSRHAPVAALDQGPQENFCRPAVDALFRSAVEVYGENVLAVVLTGMGSDGALGAIEVARAGGTVLAQDEASSVVWGMPGAVVSTGTASAVLPLSEVAGAVVNRCAAHRRTPVSALTPAVTAGGGRS